MKYLDACVDHWQGGEEIDQTVPDRHEKVLLLNLLPALLVDQDVFGPGHVPVAEDGGKDDAADHVEDLLGHDGAVAERRGPAVLP